MVTRLVGVDLLHANTWLCPEICRLCDVLLHTHDSFGPNCYYCIPTKEGRGWSCATCKPTTISLQPIGLRDVTLLTPAYWPAVLPFKQAEAVLCSLTKVSDCLCRSEVDHCLMYAS